MTLQNEEGANNVHWNVQREILLFNAMMGYKPVGVNRYFMMTLIHNRLKTSLGQPITCEPLWQHFDTMYDMAVLHDSEVSPFPNDDPIEFELPEEYDALVHQRYGIPVMRRDKDDSKDSSDKSDGKKINLKTKSSTPANSGKIGAGMAKMGTGSPSKVSSNTSPVPSLVKASRAIRLESDSESEENVPVKMEVESSGKNAKSKRTTIPTSDSKLKQEYVSQVKYNNSADSPLKKIKSETSQKKARETRSDSVESTKRNRDSTSSPKKGKQLSGIESSTNKRGGGKADITPVKRRLERTSSSERNSSSKLERGGDKQNDSEPQNSIGATKSPRVLGKADQDTKRRTRTKTEEASQKNTPTTKRRR